MYITGVVLFVLIVGFAARALLPDLQKVRSLGTALFGVFLGSLAGGVLGAMALRGNGNLQPVAGWAASIVGALVMLVAIRWIARTAPNTPVFSRRRRLIGF